MHKIEQKLQFFDCKFVGIRKKRNFANKWYGNKENDTGGGLKRWNAAKATKKAMGEKMQKVLVGEYKARTGEENELFLF